MRILLLSGYELGQQPLGVAVPAAGLAANGHEVRAADVSGAPLDDELGAWAEALVVSVPMHTALQLGLEVVRSLRTRRPGLRVALHGLYAPVAEGHPVLEAGDLLVAGDPLPALLDWLGADDRRGGTRVELGPARRDRAAAAGAVPRRDLLPPLSAYARLVRGGRRSLAGSTVTTLGCNHRCTHCPVASVYRGRSRVVDTALVLADVDQLVAAGAEHVSFADPDFLNRPRHALDVVRAFHPRWPDVTFDATVKVEHVLRYRDLWPELARSGLLFVVSAFESVDDEVLRHLRKGHSAPDEAEALAVLRSSGIEVRPSWLPFSPWTTLFAVGALLEFTARHDLVWSTDPVQYSIRLLLPRGTLLLEEPDPVLERSLVDFDPERGSYEWKSADPAVDDLQAALAELAESAAACGEPADDTFGRVWALCADHEVPLSSAEPPRPLSAARAPVAGPERPRLSEPWFCCAEPTANQRTRARVSPS